MAVVLHCCCRQRSHQRLSRRRPTHVPLGVFAVTLSLSVSLVSNVDYRQGALTNRQQAASKAPPPAPPARTDSRRSGRMHQQWLALATCPSPSGCYNGHSQALPRNEAVTAVVAAAAAAIENDDNNDFNPILLPFVNGQFCLWL